MFKILSDEFLVASLQQQFISIFLSNLYQHKDVVLANVCEYLRSKDLLQFLKL
jgi:hypothetical protein